ncbi:conserved oligomeric Golgi complex subunit 8 [Dermacentor andersoni]|uniref:conserved oligomeric Golgi complex subunit 8 n=1 Tax=Dermacentor andersoni TaxID=34620 RepID=UPI003B3AAF1E
MAAAGNVEVDFGESDYSNRDLFSIIAPPGEADAWRENADITSYVQELSSYDVQRLTHEPERLAEEKALVLEQTQKLAFENYKTFIKTAQCSKDIFKEFSVVEGKLDALQEKLPEFAKKCQQFSLQSQQITTRWRQMSQMLSKHPQLLEVLELSQLMETCVRNGCYDEALELAAYVRRLEKKHAAAIPLIASIGAEVRESQQLMLSQLVGQLRSNIQLPACLKVIGYLRRMDVYSEAELRVRFLQARGSWFDSVLNNIPTKDAYTHLTRVVEACRVHLFDIVTQYRAIFSDDDPLAGLGKDPDALGATIFYSWITSQVSRFLDIVERDLSSELSGRLDSVLSQCMYFGLSFSRVGADFRPLLARKFQQAAATRFRSSISQATERFREMMHSFTLTTLPSMAPAAMLMSTLTMQENVQPPFSLLEFEPLSQYCNAVLGAFNELRLCACLSLAREMTVVLDASLRAVVNIIVDYHTAEEPTLTEKETETLSRFCGSFANELVPFLNTCLSLLFPAAEIGKLLGVPPTYIAKLENMGHLKCEDIVQPMKHLVSDFEEDFTVPASSEIDEVNFADEKESDAVLAAEQKHSAETPDEAAASVEDAILASSIDSKDEAVSSPALVINAEPSTVVDHPASTEITVVAEPSVHDAVTDSGQSE